MVSGQFRAKIETLSHFLQQLNFLSPTLILSVFPPTYMCLPLRSVKENTVVGTDHKKNFSWSIHGIRTESVSSYIPFLLVILFQSQIKKDSFAFIIILYFRFFLDNILSKYNIKLFLATYGAVITSPIFKIKCIFILKNYL